MCNSGAVGLFWALRHTVGNAVYAACQWGMYVILARLGPPELAGQYALGIAVSAPLLMLARSNGRSARAADIRVLSLVFALLGVAAVGFLDHSVQDRMAVVLVVLAQSVEWIADLYAGQRGAVSLALHGIVSVAALGVLGATTGHPGAGLLGVLIVRLLALFFYDFKRPAASRQDDPERLLTTLATHVPCYFIAHMLGLRRLGIFAALASLTPVAMVLVDALGRAAIPGLANCYQEGDGEGFGRRSARLAGAGLALGLCMVAASIVAGPWLAGMLFGADYVVQGTLLVALAAAAGVGFMAEVLGWVLAAGLRSDVRAPLEIAAVAANSLACIALVPRTGLAGAALAAGLGALIQVIGEVWVLRSILRRPRKPVLLALLKEPLAQ